MLEISACQRFASVLVLMPIMFQLPFKNAANTTSAAVCIHHCSVPAAILKLSVFMFINYICMFNLIIKTRSSAFPIEENSCDTHTQRNRSLIILCRLPIPFGIGGKIFQNTERKSLVSL